MNNNTVPVHDTCPPETAPGWLYYPTLAVVFLAAGQYAYALHPRHGPFIAYVDVLAGLLIAAWVLWLTVNRRWSSVKWAPAPVWALFVVALLSAPGAVELTSAAVQVFQVFLYFTAAYMLFANTIRSPQQMRGVMLTIMAASTIAVVYGLVQYVSAADPEKVYSTFQSRNIYSAHIVMVIPLLLGVFMHAPLRWERWWALGLMVAGAVTIVSPPLPWVLLLVLCVMSFMLARRGFARVFVPSAIILGIVVFAFLPLNKIVLEELADPYERGEAFKTMDGMDVEEGTLLKKRWIEWLPSLNMLAENYMLGVGAGNYQANIGRPEFYGFLPNVRKSEPDTNNLYLVIAGSMGFAGLVCLIALMAHFLKRAAGLWLWAETPWERALAAGLFGATLAIPLVNIFTSLFVRGTGMTWIVIYALVGVLAKEVSVKCESREISDVAQSNHTGESAK